MHGHCPNAEEMCYSFSFQMLSRSGFALQKSFDAHTPHARTSLPSSRCLKLRQMGNAVRSLTTSIQPGTLFLKDTVFSMKSYTLSKGKSGRSRCISRSHCPGPNLRACDAGCGPDRWWHVSRCTGLRHVPCS